MPIPSGYDPVTLNHWLWFKYLCHEGTSTEFQRLFENIIKRARPEFIQIRPYGQLGDRKCDGLLRNEGNIFQVYSPDEIVLAKLKAKIDEDLDYVVDYWRDILQTWTFVYNARGGVAADVAVELHRKQQQYPHLSIEELSGDGLWEMARSLSLQQRAEILGAPLGYEHLFFVTDSTPEEIREMIDQSWAVIIQDINSPVKLQDVIAALEPSVPFGAPFYVRPQMNQLSWDEAAEYQQKKVQELLDRTWDTLPRYAVFSMAPIPLAIHLGFLLSDRVETRYFQYDRDRRTWKWPENSQHNSEITVSGLPTAATEAEIDVVIRVSLSAKVWPYQSDAVVPEPGIAIDISVSNPHPMWLTSTEQLTDVGRLFRDVLASIRANIPRCKAIHLFYAGPTGGAVIIGQQINPRMNPPVALHEFSQQATPQYQRVMTLRAEMKAR